MDITEDTIKWLFVQHAMGFLYMAISVCVLYDHVTTLDEEIELVWNRPRWSMVQFLYMVNRYLGNAFQIYSAYAYTKYIVTGTNELYVKDTHTCSFIHPKRGSHSTGPAYHVVAGYLLSLATLSMHGIMIFRVSSMYNHNRRIIALLAGALFIECVVVLSIQIASYNPRVFVQAPAPGVLLCVQKSFPPWMYILWLPVIFFETLIFGLSLSLAMVYYKSLRHMANLHRAPIKSYFHQYDSLAYILLRDSITFPFFAVSVCIVNLTVWYYLPHLWIQIAFAFAGFAPCILGPRLVLNLREAYYQPFNQECTGMYELDVEVTCDHLEDPVDGMFLVADSHSRSRSHSHLSASNANAANSNLDSDFYPDHRQPTPLPSIQR